MEQYGPLFFIIYASFAIAGGVMLFSVSVWLSQQTTQQRYAKPFLGLIFSISIWSGFSGVIVLAPTLPLKIGLLTPLTVASIFTAPFWLHFATTYIGKWTRRYKALVYLGYASAGLFSVIIVTNQWHYLFWADFQLINVGWPLLEREPTLVWWVCYVWAYAMSVGSIALVGYRSLETNDLHNTKHIVYVFGSLIPISFELYTTLGFSPHSLDYTPIGFTIWGILLVYVFFSHAFYNVSPIGRKYAFESIDNPIVIYDHNGLLTDWNPNAKQLLIPNPGGAEWLDVFDETARAQIQEQTANDTDGLIDESNHPIPHNRHFEGVTINCSGEEHVYNIQLTPIVPDNELRGYVVVFYDTTTIVKHKEELEKQNKRLEQFASIVSHDLRNPINVARGYSNMVDGNAEPVSKIGGALDRMEDIINQILVLTREEEAVSKSDTVSIVDAATDAWELVNTFDGEVEIDTDLEVEADRGHVLSVFENLFRNVYDHCETDTNVYVGSLDDETGFYVADGGPGIPSDKQDTVFDEGHTTSDTGSGLGLFIVKKIVDGHDWEIRIDDDTDEYGAKFDIITEPSP